MKKNIINLFAIAAIGLAVTACGGHHDHDRDHDRDNQDQPSTTTTTEHHSDEGRKEPKENHEKTEVPTEKGTPKVDTADAVKPKDESTMGNTETKHHVKPGGVH